MAMTKRLAGIVLAVLAWVGLARSGLGPAEYFPPPLTVAANCLRRSCKIGK